MISFEYDSARPPASDALTVNDTVSPARNPFGPTDDVIDEMVGGVPTVMVWVVTAWRPVESVTRRVALKDPLVVYVNDGATPVPSKVPLPSKSHAYELIVEGATALEPAALNATVNGAVPDEGVAVNAAVGRLATPKR